MGVVESKIEDAVKERYARGATTAEKALCCPVEYDPRYLDAIPDEVLERDYGCGDPTAYLHVGETVLDLGSGAGKVCFIAAQVVGPRGRVIGVDMTPEMIGLARSAAPVVAERVGYANVEFRRGRIEDLALDLDRLDAELARDPVTDAHDLAAANARVEELRRSAPLVEPASIDVVVSNCVLNLVAHGAKRRLFAGIHRVLKEGGRAVISDIVSDEPVPAHLQGDPQLWSGCVAGALTETAFLEAFENAGFHGIRLLERRAEPWRTVEGIEFRSVTIEALKGEDGPCLECRQAVVYRGPFREVLDDDGHRLRRGVRQAICDKTYRLYGRPPYEGQFLFIDPREPVSPEEAEAFDCSRSPVRHARETKGSEYDATTTGPGEPCCGPNGRC